MMERVHLLLKIPPFLPTETAMTDIPAGDDRTLGSRARRRRRWWLLGTGAVAGCVLFGLLAEAVDRVREAAALSH
jgi:hypothetical protein